MTAVTFRRVLLVGFMGSGKSTVGREVAARLGWDFLDFDREIEAASGRPIAAIFREEGEARFREMEAEVGATLLERPHAVLASGGGWAVSPGRMEGLSADTLSVWLKVTPETAVRRILSESEEESSHGGPALRPLLDRPDPVGEAKRLLRQREGFYARADLILDTEGRTASQLAEQVVRHLKAETPRGGNG